MATAKKKHSTVLTVLIIFFLTNLRLCTQPVWQWSRPKPTGNFLHSVYFPNRLTGYAAGVLGTIIKTTDSGIEWSLLYSNTSQDLSGIIFINASTGLTVGKGGIILKSTNGGDSWAIRQSNTNNYLYDITFTDSITGYAAGLNGTILKTTDAGDTWIQLVSGSNAPLFCLNFFDKNTGVAGGYNTILKTTNGGLTWTIQNANIVASSSVVGISMTDSNKIFAAGNSPGGIFYKSTDGGVSWTRKSLGLSYLFDGSVDLVRSQSFLNSNTGFVISDFGTILKTTNSGNEWIHDSTFRPSYEKLSVMYDITILDSDFISIAGSGGNIFKSTNTGINWMPLTGNKNSIRGNYFTDQVTGYCVGEGGSILKTENKGKTWQPSPSVTNNFLNSVFFVNKYSGYISGDSGLILQTSKPKYGWTIQASRTQENLNSIFFPDKNNGIAVGGTESNSHAAIMGTTDGGKNWHIRFDSAALGVLKSVYFINSSTGIAVGKNGNVLRTTDAGLTWKCENIFYGDFNSVSFFDSENGLIAGSDGVIYKTTNSGIDWTKVETGIFTNLNSVKCSAGNNAVAAGENGIVISSADLGINWIPETKISGNSIFSVNIFDNGNESAFGEYGTIINSETKNPLTEDSFASKRTKAGFNLSQNYPNPFNPSTNINFALLSNNEVRVTVYNILGEQVAKLIDEKKEAGSYSVTFNSENLASGIYFYSLLVNEVRVDTKRMLLIK